MCTRKNDEFEGTTYVCTGHRGHPAGRGRPAPSPRSGSAGTQVWAGFRAPSCLPCRHSDDANTPSCAPLIISSPPWCWSLQFGGVDRPALEVPQGCECVAFLSAFTYLPRESAQNDTEHSLVLSGQEWSCLVHSYTAASRSTQCGCRLCFFL